MQQGEVWARADAPAHALIVSADLYNRAGTSRVVVCPVIPGDPLPHDDYAADAWQRVDQILRRILGH
ncbi:hypothetical protein [Frankia sp. AgB32]|uniref:hypothetical protein n=1 Tax=Frankia sp. AgB32 TaxID=631119 RepID=UPI00200D65EE|nr:hypothetical protein [Frankia sp. AgB32]MCK9894095.1 hypothetical protein [Frankia sp. AgB32]